ncbi:hypothetical protein [Streptomyces sp. NPDC000134]|uniref:hypothetical protein n=1 Tax=Streptomyces sp. NPDC000134 TaxID=3364536 RepID=UPI0036ACA99A
MVVRDDRLREQRYEAGPGGIHRAVFLPPDGDAWDAATRRPAERWGVLVFRADDGRDLLTAPLADWLPEAGAVGVAELRPSECLGRTGLRDVVAAVGIPLEERAHGSRDGTGTGRYDRSRGARPDRASHSELPRWHGRARGIGLLGWFIGMVVGFASGLDWALTIAAFGLLLVPSADAILRLSAWWRTRRDTTVSVATVIRPAPAAGTETTRRFLRTAVVRVTPREVVLTNTVGEERRLGRTGTHGAARMVSLVAPDTGERLGVEIRDGAGRARALLPYRYWFSGPGGADRWAELAGALGGTATDEELRHTNDGDPWWHGHVLAADARRMSPMDARTARTETDWHRAVIGGNELIVVPLMAAVLLAGLFGGTVPEFTAGLLSALTIVATWGPVSVSSLASRLYLDRVRQNPTNR